MIKSMTGFGSAEAEITSFGKISIELRSSNHKFFETVFHLPERFLSVEDKLKKEIESKIKRGRVTCAVNIISGKEASVFINRSLLKEYIKTLNGLKKQFQIKDEISINTLIHLPGVLALKENGIAKIDIWPKLKVLLARALADLVKTREKEGQALYKLLKNRAELLRVNLGNVKTRFNKVTKEKLKALKTDEERANFLRDTDISEEIERLSFHIRNFKNKLLRSEPIGKELDFIAQEMQREANTLAAKTFDASVSARVVQIKSQVEKIREQVQNIE